MEEKVLVECGLAGGAEVVEVLGSLALISIPRGGFVWREIDELELAEDE